MQKMEEAWWDQFRDGHIGIQLCEKCAISQFPPGNMCRGCGSQTGLSIHALGNEPVKVSAKTVVARAVTPLAERSVPYILATFCTASGVRITLPTCRVKTVRERNIDGDSTQVRKTMEAMRDAGQTLEVTVCDCERLLVPHVSAMECGVKK